MEQVMTIFFGWFLTIAVALLAFTMCMLLAFRRQPPKPILWVKCAPDTPRTYEIVFEGGEAIKFRPCGVMSWSRGDIDNRYCAYCGHTATWTSPRPMTPEELSQQDDGRG